MFALCRKRCQNKDRPAGPEQGMQNGSKSLFCGQPAPAGAQQCPAAKQQQGKQDVPPNAVGQREQKAVFLPDGTGKHIHMVHKEQPQAVPPQKAERRPQSVIGVQFTAQMAEDPDAAYTD